MYHIKEQAKRSIFEYHRNVL
ncbi:MAG: hypothetical protein AB7D49_09930 [Arcobacter sp.]